MPQKLDPAVAAADMRAAGLEPLEQYPGRHTPWRCQCVKCEKGVTPTLRRIRSGYDGCKYCSRDAKSKKLRGDAGEAVADMLAAGLEPLEDYQNALTPWRCQWVTWGKEVSPTLSSIRSGSGGCKYCTRRVVDPEEAVADMRAAGLEPLDDYPGSNAPWRCRCLTCNKEVFPRLGGIRSGQGGCKYCSVVRGARKLRGDAGEAVADMRAAGLEPLEQYQGRHTPWRCQCLTCGKEVSPMLGSIRSGRGGCKYCTRRVVDPVEALEFIQAAGLKPLEQYPGASKPWRCQCLTCGKEVSPITSSIRNGGGCKYCAVGGLDWAAPTLVYLIHHKKFGAYKVGITGVGAKQNRLKGFSALGWEIHKTLEFPTGDDAHKVEQIVLDPYREQNFCPYLTPDLMKPLGGHSETIDAEAVDLLELWTEIEDAAKAIQGLSGEPIL